MDSETLLDPVVYPLSWPTIVRWFRTAHIRILVRKMEYSNSKLFWATNYARFRSWICCFVFTCCLIVAGLLAYYLGDVRVQMAQAERLKALLLSNVTQKDDLRLPLNVIPSHYDIRLLPILENSTVFGQVSIDLRCLNETDSIILHSVDIKVDLPSVQVFLISFHSVLSSL